LKRLIRTHGKVLLIPSKNNFADIAIAAVINKLDSISVIEITFD